MNLVEIARYQDVYEADLAAAFLSARGIEVEVTERFQTTVDPLMQRALGLRLIGRSDQALEACDLLARAARGEFADNDVDNPPSADPTTRAVGRGLALTLAAMGAFWGNSLPRRLRMVHWIGLVLIACVVALYVIASLYAWF
ncbi:hypothetical protein [Brevundimonas sp.]|uniref:hypothetical protein n=1 Tax=Brevundimonas sp. TaxID=1871086 RepID=UPI001ACF3242|nr:hypothetical protein [Brevundimonas sp.]MBN9465725.1 hypothetical protein [Brevundimonas sp.]